MITTVTMNASIDKAYYMEGNAENGTVMRVAFVHNSAGGKGLNVARAAMLCGAEVQATGLVGGFNGMYLENMLKADGVNSNFIHVSGETRSCINILDKKYGSTEYLEPGFTVTEKEQKEFLEKYPDIIEKSEVVTISGSLPKGLSPEFYGKITVMAERMEKKVILDSSGATLREGLKGHPTLVKPNQDEIEMLFDTKIRGLEDVILCAKRLHEEKEIPYVVISLGGDGALMVCEKGVFRGISPKVEAVNTVGCGDSMVAGLAVALEQNRMPEEMLSYAMAVGAANALSPDTGRFDPEMIPELEKKAVVNKVQK